MAKYEQTRVGILGTGTCRLSLARKTSSAYLRSGSSLLLIDCGASIPEQLERYDLLEGCSSLDIHISHRHTDHFIGLFPLLHGLTWSDDAKHLQISQVRIHCTEEVAALYKTISSALGEHSFDLKGGGSPQSEKRSVEIHTGPDLKDWEYTAAGIKCSSVHLPSVNNHGVAFKVNGKKFAISCDGTEAGKELTDFLSNTDVAVIDFGHLYNAHSAERGWHYDPEPLVKLLSESASSAKVIAGHPYLRAEQEKALTEKERDSLLRKQISEVETLAKKRGFQGTFELGEDGMILG